MNQFRVVNFGSTILATLLGALLLLVCLKFPVWGIIQVERKFEVYHFVSRDTVATLDEMSATLGDFGEACEAHQAAERDLLILGDCAMVTVSGDKSCEDLRVEAQTDVEQATADMHKAVAARKALAARADWGLMKSMLIGGQGYTHSTWLCAPAYATFSTQINVGFTPTYDPTS